jgi:hypothetical protein
VTAALPPTSFARRLIAENNLDAKGFGRWLFYPGMLFHTTAKWWGKPGFRKSPHEGLDVCLFRDAAGRMQKLDEQTRIPVLYDGRVALIIDDFLGHSIFMDHGFRIQAGARLFTAFGHTRPLDRLQVGQAVGEGEIVATIADFDTIKKPILPHVHVSMGWVREECAFESLNWNILGSHPSVSLMDPLAVFGEEYEIAGADADSVCLQNGHC